MYFLLMSKVRKSCFKILLKNSHVHILNLLTFISIVLFNVEATQENAKLAGILQSLKWHR